MVHFVGAGPGAPDLITVRGKELIEQADQIIYAGSLVNPALLSWARKDCQIYDSSRMTLEEVLEAIREAEKAGKTTVRLHTGDSSLYGTIQEQIRPLREEGIAWDVTPGVSSFLAAAASLSASYTQPLVSQSVILTRMEGRTPMPEKEQIEAFASHQATMVLFLSTDRAEELSRRLIRGGYPADTPAAIVYKASWPEEKKIRCTVGTLGKAREELGEERTALILVGEALGEAKEGRSRSLLYDPSFATLYREEKNED